MLVVAPLLLAAASCDPARRARGPGRGQPTGWKSRWVAGRSS